MRNRACIFFAANGGQSFAADRRNVRTERSSILILMRCMSWYELELVFNDVVVECDCLHVLGAAALDIIWSKSFPWTWATNLQPALSPQQWRELLN